MYFTEHTNIKYAMLLNWNYFLIYILVFPNISLYYFRGRYTNIFCLHITTA